MGGTGGFGFGVIGEALAGEGVFLWVAAVDAVVFPSAGAIGVHLLSVLTRIIHEPSTTTAEMLESAALGLY